MFVFCYDNTDNNRATVDSHQKYFIPTVKTENYTIETDGRNFYDEPINDLMKQYESTGQGDDYTTGYLSSFAYSRNN